MTRLRLVGLALGALGAVIVAVVVILASSGSTEAANTPSKPQGSSTVQRRDLIATDTESGTLSYAAPQTVFNRMSGTITWLPPIGRVVKPGHALYKVDGSPVVLFNGTLPAYRDLSESDTDGPDIEQLKRNLNQLGFDSGQPLTINQTFDAATVDAVERWQASVGEAQTGSISLGQVVFLPGDQRVTSVDAALGSNGGSSSAAAASATNTSTTPTSRAEFVSLTTNDASQSWTASDASALAAACKQARSMSSKTKHPVPNGCNQNGKASPITKQQELAALLALLKAETLELQKSSHGSSGSGSGSSSAGSSGSGGGGRSGGSGFSAGSGGGAAGGGTASAAAAVQSASGSSGGSGGSGGGANAQPILQTTSTQLVVTVDLDATMQSEAVVHEPVTVELPDGTTVGGKITQVSPVAQSTSSSSSSSSSSTSGGGGGGGSNAPSATVPVTITLTGHRKVAGLDQAAVSVNFEQQKATNVLSVPVTALLATAGGGYAVQEASAPNKLIPVTPGLFAAGYVQVSGAGVFPGLQVTDSQG